MVREIAEKIRRKSTQLLCKDIPSTTKRVFGLRHLDTSGVVKRSKL